jgi:N-acetylneuraminate lyase
MCVEATCYYQIVAVCGTTGEGATMSTPERESVLDRWVTAADGRIHIIAHVGAESIADAQTLARHAEKLGVSAIGAYVPTFNRPPGVDSVVDMLALLSEAAPKVRLIECAAFHCVCIVHH